MSKIQFKMLAVVSIMLISFTSFGAQSASAADAPTDLSVNVFTVADQQLYAMSICNTGSTTVKSITTTLDFTNFETLRGVSLPAGFGGVSASDSGSFDLDSKVWTGTLDGGQCIALGLSGNITAPIGDTVSLTASIVSSVLSDDSVNIDPDNSNDTNTFTSNPEPLRPVLEITPRLLTQGVISTGDEVQYEITYANIGAGDYVNSASNQLPLGLYFIMPTGSSLTSVTDDDLGDDISIPSGGCSEVGSTSLIGPGLDNNYPGVVAGCSFDDSSILVSGQSITFTVTFNAGASYTSGATGVWAIAIGNDPTGLIFQIDAATGVDVFATPRPSVKHLIFDADALNVIINRCPGQGETTLDGTGCFRVTFSKLIFAPSFTQDDMVLIGNGNITGFTQVDDYSWDVTVAGIAKGSTLKLSMDAAKVNDYSAIQNQVQVLGENTIRFVDEQADNNGGVNQTGQPGQIDGDGSVVNSAQGTLANTGKNIDVFTPAMLLIFGLSLLMFTNDKKRKELLNSIKARIKS